MLLSFYTLTGDAWSRSLAFLDVDSTSAHHHPVLHVAIPDPNHAVYHQCNRTPSRMNHTANP